MINAFLQFLEFEKRSSEHTVKSYQNDLAQFEKYLRFQYDQQDTVQVQPAMLRSWVVSLMEEKLSPVSVNRKIACLRSYYKYLLKRGHIQKDPTTILTSLKSRKKLPAFVEEKAMSALFDHDLFAEDFAGQRDRLVLELLYGSGMRLSELIGLEMNQIDLLSRTLKVFGKRSKERIVPISPTLAELIRSYLVVRMPPVEGDYLILTDTGKMAYPVLIQRIVKKYLSTVTTLSKKSPHVLRHTYATHLLNRGADLNAIKELLGHANLAATQIYTHNSIEKLKKTHEQAHPKA